MKYGFIADIHLNTTDSLSPIDASTGLSIRTLDKLNAIEEALKVSITNGCEAFFFMGDIYDKLNPTERLKESFLRTIVPYANQIKIYIFPGNHDGADFTNNFLSETAILEKLEIPLFQIIHEPTNLYFNKGKDKFLIIPWITDHDVIKDIINEQEEGQILLGHFEIFGAATSTEYQITKGLHPGIFKKFKFVALGHYHKFQKLAMNLIYVGSPIIKDFSEIDDPDKGFIIYDSTKNDFTRHRLEKRHGYTYIISNETLESVDYEIEKSPPIEGSLIELEFRGTKKWINEVLRSVIQIFNEFKPLKIRRKKVIYKEENIKSKEILALKNRIERIKEISKNETEDIQNLGIQIFREAENEYLEVKV